MDGEQVTHDIKELAQKVKCAVQVRIANSTELDETIALTNALQQPTANSTLDLDQETLIAVNSQALLPVVNQSLFDERSSYIMATQIGKGAEGNIQPPISASNNDVSPMEGVSNTSTSAEGCDMDSSNPLIRDFNELFAVGKKFDSLDELRKTALQYGKRYNVALTTSKSDKTKVYLICKHGGVYRKNVKKAAVAAALPTTTVKTRVRKSQKSGCSCLIYARCSSKGSAWTIRKSIAKHNHPIASDPRTYAMYRNLEPDQLALVHRLVGEGTSISGIVKILKDQGVNNIVPKDIENIQQDLKRKQAALLKQQQQQEASNEATVIAQEPFLLPKTESSSSTSDIEAAAAAAVSNLLAYSETIVAQQHQSTTEVVTLPPE